MGILNSKMFYNVLFHRYRRTDKIDKTFKDWILYLHEDPIFVLNDFMYDFNNDMF